MEKLKTYKIGVVGSRHFRNKEFLEEVFDRLFPACGLEIVSGGASGVDTLAKNLARERNYVYKEFLPKEGSTFGMKCFNRNKEIVDYSNCLLALWDGRTERCGTLITMQLAVKAGKPMYAVGVKV